MMDRVRRAAGAGESQAHAGDDLWASYKALSYEDRNAFAVRLLREQLSNQKYLLYGWPVQALYSRYATDFLPSETRLRILELGPGDNLMATALWMLEERVEKLTLLDMFKGAYMDKAAYHAPLIELVQILNHLPRSAFNNYYPFEQRSADSVEKAVHCQEDGSIALEPTRLSFVLTDDFTAFPFEDGQFNYIYSHAALEHYLDPDASIGEMNRTLEVGGLMVHQIDIRDHRFFEKDPFRYLEEPSTRWQFGSLGFPVNQWRVSQFRDAFLKNGFELLEECKVRRESDKLEGVKLAPEFAGMPPDEVVVTRVVFVLKKRADAVAARENRQKVQWSPPQTEKPGRAGKETLRNPDSSAWADAAPEGRESWDTRVARPGPDEGMALQLTDPDKNGGLVQRA